MAVIPREALDYLTGQINTLSGDAQAKILTVLEQIEWTPDNIADCRNLILHALQEILPAYTDLVAQAGADFYDAARELALGETLGAVAESGYEPEKTDNAVRAFVQDIVDGKPASQFNDQVLQRVDYEMKHAAGNTMFANGARDPKRPKYARVPTGAETCGFCIMLASRGFDYTSKEAAGSLGHYHASCDCRIVASWDNLEVENYDPDAYYEIYEEARTRLGGYATGNRLTNEIRKILAEHTGREKAFIPESKLTRYALDKTSERGKDKAIAFELALGYTLEDASEIMSQVYRWMGENDPTKTGENEWGEIYSADIRMTGKNGKTANVRTGWIRHPGEDTMRLTSIYVH